MSKFLDETGVAELSSKLKTYVQNALPTKTSDLVNDSGFVDSVTGGSANGTISVNGSDVAVTGLGDRAYDSTSYLPVEGGTLTGNLSIDPNTTTGQGGVVGRTSNGIRVAAEALAMADAGAFLDLFGRNSSNSGRFSINANGKNGNKQLVGDANGTLTWDSKAIALAPNVLALTGGTMTGTILSSNTTTLGMSANNSYLRIMGGNSSQTGGNLVLRGTSYGNSAGGFDLIARGTVSVSFVGKSDGTLTWDGQPLQTSSDKRLKQDFADVPADVLEVWGKVKWKQFKYIADAERKGDSCRWHTGLVAQDVKEVGEDNNVDLLKYGILCHDVQEADDEHEAVDLWTIRYEEALAMEAIYQRKRADRLEARLEALEEILRV